MNDTIFLHIAAVFNDDLPPIAAQYGWRSPFAIMAAFGVILALGFALLYLSLVVLIPLSAVFLKTFTLSTQKIAS